MPNPASTDCLIVGGGVIGLSLAYELSRAGRSVRVLERKKPGREAASLGGASWAGAGILPPGSWYSDHPAMEDLADISRGLNKAWSQQLEDETGVDDQLQQLGSLYAITPATAHALQTKFDAWRQRGVEVQRLSPTDAEAIEPAAPGRDCFFVPEECAVRNPRRLEAVRNACKGRGVEILSNQEVTGFEKLDDRITAAMTSEGNFAASEFCLASGAWTGGLAANLQLVAPVRPVRGQMVLLRLPQPSIRRVYHAQGKYIVPRRDGHVLVGATVEEAGFDCSTSDQDIAELIQFAHTTMPCLREAEFIEAWAGLRPATTDELPLIGRLPEYTNGWIAAGHFRAGLQLAPATAVVVRQLMDSSPVSIDSQPFSPQRCQTLASH